MPAWAGSSGRKRTSEAVSEEGPERPWLLDLPRCGEVLQYPTMSSAPNCSSVLKNIVDRPPTRIPFVGIDYIASIAAGKTFVEIGSRNGDAIECISRVTRSAVSIEADSRRYCKTLSRRAAESGGRWTSKCALFSVQLQPVPAAQIYFAWMPHYLDVALLANFQALQRRGAIPPDADFVLGFAHRNHMPEYRCYRAMQKCGSRNEDIHFNEALPGESPRSAWRHRRAGTFHLVTFRPIELNMSAVQDSTSGICHKGNAIAHVIAASDRLD